MEGKKRPALLILTTHRVTHI